MSNIPLASTLGKVNSLPSVGVSKGLYAGGTQDVAKTLLHRLNVGSQLANRLLLSGIAGHQGDIRQVMTGNSPISLQNITAYGLNSANQALDLQSKVKNDEINIVQISQLLATQYGVLRSIASNI